MRKSGSQRGRPDRHGGDVIPVITLEEQLMLISVIYNPTVTAVPIGEKSEVLSHD
jgi:hypothetical protein